MRINGNPPRTAGSVAKTGLCTSETAFRYAVRMSRRASFAHGTSLMGSGRIGMIGDLPSKCRAGGLNRTCELPASGANHPRA